MSAVLDRYFAHGVAMILGYASLAAFEADRNKGLIPPLDGRWHGLPYWLTETVERVRSDLAKEGGP